MNDVADIIIIGSGASGAAAAWSLSRDKSLRIVCFEQGSISNMSDYPTKSEDWELSRSEKSSFDPNIRKNLADYPIDDSDSPISIANFNGYGGSTILYSAHFPRFHPSDFRVKTLDNIADDWPLGYSDLNPYFDENEKKMGVAGLVGDTAYPEYSSLLPPVPLGDMGKKLAKAFNEMNWHWWPSYAAINTDKRNNRANCINLGPCNVGCSQGAKGSVDVTYWPLAKLNGVEVYTESRVYEITLDKKGLADGILYFDKHGNECQFKAKIVIVACSGIGTPRLLLNSKSEAFPDGLLNDNGLVGKNLMLHPLAYVEGVFDEDLKSSIGPHGCCILSQEFYETRSENNFSRGYTMQILRGAPPIESATTGYFMRQLSIGKNHHQDFQKLFNHTAGIAIISEDLPEKHNRVELDYENKDSFGLPGVKVHYEMSENTKKILKHGIKMSKEIFSSAGAKVTSSFAPVKNSGWHLMGTARMGSDPKTSVVNKFGQAHQVKNIFIVDSSVFVTSGAVNPVATAQAITLFSCNYIRENISNISNPL
jgi:choline dehydrogenase-like flavoprotein